MTLRRSAASLAALLLAACGTSEPLAPSAIDAPVDPAPVGLSKAVNFRAPAGTRATATHTTLDGASGAILPNGRFVTPAGTEYSVGAAKPFELALSPDGRWAATINSGAPASVSLLGPLDGTAAVTKLDLRTVFMGLAFSPDSARFYAAGGDGGLVWIGDTASQAIIGSVNLNGAAHPLTRPMTTADTGAFTGGAFAARLALTRDGATLYVLDQAGFAVHVIDTARLQTGTDANGAIIEPDNFDALVGRAATGRYPFGIALAPDDRRLYISNIGVLQFTSLRPAEPSDDANLDFPICFPVQGYPDDLGAKQIEIRPLDPRALGTALREPDAAIGCGYTGPERSYVVPPLGDPNAPEASSVYIYDVAGTTPQRLRVIKTGKLVGDIDEGIRTYAGNHPNALVAGSTMLYVSNGSDDSVSLIDATSFMEVARIKLSPLTGADAALKGVQPVDLALSPDEKYLYVAEPGLNAIGVIDLSQRRVIGHIPTGWWTSAIGVASDGHRLFAASARGRGSGPFASSNDGTLGTLNVIAAPDATQLAAYTERVLANNGFTEQPPANDGNPVPATAGAASAQIKHVVFIFKENAKYDYFMGHITATTSGQAVDGLPAVSLGAATAVNHTAIAQQFTFSDNLYLEPVVSSDGHRWLGGSYTTEFEETNWPAAYGGGGASNAPSNPETIANYPGRLGYPGSNGGPNPQDYNKHGGMFVHLARHDVSFFNFGLGLELTASDEGGGLEPTGMRMRVNMPVESVLLANTDQRFPTYNTAIPDAPLPNDPGRFNRFGRFKQVFESRFVEGGVCKMPAVMTIYYPNDHTGGANSIEPNWTAGRYIQDNDAALGMTVDYLSHTPCWANMAIFVTEDDTQSGIDHVDGSRVVNMVASPYVKHGTVLKTHTSLMSMFKTAYLILGIPPLTLYDALATDLREMFQAEPDLTPYTFIEPAYQPTGNELTAGSPQAERAAAWARLTQDIDFSAPDADERRLNCAILQSEGLLPAPLQCNAAPGADDDD